MPIVYTSVSFRLDGAIRAATDRFLPIGIARSTNSFYLVDLDHNWWEVQCYEGFQHDDMFDFGDRFPMDAATASAEIQGIKQTEKA